MLHASFCSGEVRATGTFSRPLVYLDHWAIRRFSQSPEIAQRLLRVLTDRGHLAISVALMYEIGRQDAGASVNDITALLSRVGERFWLLDVQALRVERRMRDCGLSLDEASLDVEEAMGCATVTQFESGWLTADQVLVRFRHDREGARKWDELLAPLKAGIREMIEKARHHAWHGPISVDASGGAASTCLGELVRAAIDAPKKPVDNDSVDIFHAAVPLAVCDFVLLDDGWKQRAEDIPKPPRRAEVFSGKKGQIEAFLDALERWPSPPPEAK
jgi:hypothetical protein